MKVKRLSMNAFRGFDQLTLEFNPELPTIIIGVNGVGKSSIIDCLAILLSWLTARIQFDPEAAGSFMKLEKGHHYSGLNKDLANGRLFSHMDVKEGRVEIENKIAIVIQTSREISWQITKTEKSQTINAKNELDAFTDTLRNQWKMSPKFNLPLAVYYPVNRAVFDIPLKIIEKIDFNQIEAYDEALTGMKIGFSSFFQWFRVLEDLENEERRDNSEYRDRNLEAVRQAISSLIPEFYKLRVRRSPLRLTVEKEGEELTINQLSDGEKCLLAMVGDLARRLAIANPGLDDPLQGQGVVLIDEIELHLHPKWQREIIPALTRTFPNCQFIVTTHSPQVLSQVKPEGIYILEKEDERIVAKKPESSYGRDSNRILEDLMDVPERPQDIKDRLLELFRLIDKGDIESARQIRQQLALEIGEDEPEFVSADVLIRRKEILN